MISVDIVTSTTNKTVIVNNPTEETVGAILSRANVSTSGATISLNGVVNIDTSKNLLQLGIADGSEGVMLTAIVKADSNK